MSSNIVIMLLTTFCIYKEIGVQCRKGPALARARGVWPFCVRSFGGKTRSASEAAVGAVTLSFALVLAARSPASLSPLSPVGPSARRPPILAPLQSEVAL